MAPKKPLLISLCILTVCLSAVIYGLVLVPQPSAPASRTIVVPDDFESVQDAVNNASAGDTVFVKSGVYRTWATEGVNVSKSISLIGENCQTTVLTRYPVEYARYAETTLYIPGDNVVVSGFTITGSIDGIFLSGSNCRVSGNIVKNNLMDGIYVIGKHNEISGNTIINNYSHGIYQGSSNCVISKNYVTQSPCAIVVDSCKNITITQNQLVNNTGGLRLRWDGPYYVFENTITKNTDYGIEFAEMCNNAEIHSNNITKNRIGISLYNYVISDYPNRTFGVNNKVYKNNIAENTQNVHIETTRRYGLVGANGTDVVAWDNGSIGNYWGDYQIRYPNASEIGSTGVAGMPYVINSNNTDHYPLVRPADTDTANEEQIQTLSPTSLIWVLVFVGSKLYFISRTP